MAQAWHHAILPLASMRDRRTEIRWGIRDFELRFGHRPAGIWLPETAVDLPTLNIAAEEGIRYTILAPWQAGTAGDLDTRRPYRVDVGSGRSIVVMFYDRALSTAVSFDKAATRNADAFAREQVAPRLLDHLPGGMPPLILVATDGELYGHHQRFRDLFLARLTGVGTWPPGQAVAAQRGVVPRWGGDPDALTADPLDPATRAPRARMPAGAPADGGFDIVTLGDMLASPRWRAYPLMTIHERSSWSCLHGVARWSAECPDAADGSWKQPLRAALDRLSGAIDAVTEAAADRLSVDAWAARDAWADVASGFAEPDEVVERAFEMSVSGAPARAARLAGDRDAAPLLRDLLAAQASRLAMFASDGWFWDDPVRPETLQVLRFAAHAVRLVDRHARGRLEPALLDDLRALRSPSTRRDGSALYAHALSQVGQPAPRQGMSSSA